MERILADIDGDPLFDHLVGLREQPPRNFNSERRFGKDSHKVAKK
jgi:hypothetical protein